MVAALWSSQQERMPVFESWSEYIDWYVPE